MRGRKSGVLILIPLFAAVWYLTGLLKHHPASLPSLSAPASAGKAGYVNPLTGERWGLARTDQGVDYLPDVSGEPVRAIGTGVVIYSSTTTGWPGGAFISYKLSAGPARGAVIYVAEHLGGLLPVGAQVHPGEQIAAAYPGYPWTEWGWATCSGDFPVVEYNGAPDGTPMTGGLAFARFMRSLGAKTLENPGPGPDIMKC
jgi:hypothetical protein